MTTTTQFWKDRITKTEALILVYEDALMAFAATPIETYRIDTGQTTQTVTRANMASLQRQLDGLYNRYATMCARVNGAGTITRAAF